MARIVSLLKYLGSYFTREGREKHWENGLASFLPSVPYHHEVTLKGTDEAARTSKKQNPRYKFRDKMVARYNQLAGLAAGYPSETGDSDNYLSLLEEVRARRLQNETVRRLKKEKANLALERFYGRLSELFEEGDNGELESLTKEAASSASLMPQNQTQQGEARQLF